MNGRSLYKEPRRSARAVGAMAVYAAYRHIELDNVGYGKKR